LKSIRFVNESAGFAVGPQGIILKTTNGGGFFVEISNPPSNTNPLKIFPNPSNNNITIETPAKGQLSILNLHGQQLITRQLTELKTQLDISNLPFGVYLVKLVGEKGVQVGKFIKQ
jgi:hypothetical protein